MAVTHVPKTELPWNDSDQKNFRLIMILMLSVVLILGIIVPIIKLKAIDRAELEKVPPQLAKIIKRKKIEKAKPKPKPKAKKQEKKPEVKKEKPKEKPKVKDKPKPKKKPKAKPKKKVAKAKRVKAKAKAKKAFGNKALAALSNIKSSVPIAALNTSSKGLSNKGNKATAVGSVIDRSAASRGSGGVSVAALTTATVGESLSARDVTAIELSAEEIQIEESASSRSQEELRLVIGQHKTAFDRIHRKALRNNPTLEGMVVLKLEIQPNGEVSSCSISESEIKDARFKKRLVSRCRLISFEDKPDVDITVAEYPIRFTP